MTWFLTYVAVGLIVAAMVARADPDGMSGGDAVVTAVAWPVYVGAWALGWGLAAFALLVGRWRSGRR